MNHATYARPGADLSTLRERIGKRSIVLVGLMGAGKSSIGRRLAEALGVPFVDADTQIEAAAGKTIQEIFAEHGEAYFRDGERRVIQRLLTDGRQVLATGGGAFMNPETRAQIREHGISVWLKADLEVLMNRVRRRNNRPLLKTDDPEAVMRRLIDERYPVYAEADVTVQSREVPHEVIVGEIIGALSRLIAAPAGDTAARTVTVDLGVRSYQIRIGSGLVEHAGAAIAATLPGARAFVVTDANVARDHLPRLQASLAGTGLSLGHAVLTPGEATKNFDELARLCGQMLDAGVERGDVVVAFGGGVIGDLAAFAASILRRGVRLVQIPTSLLAQVDSSVGGKTGINTRQGKNLIGTFHQPSLVLADTGVLTSLPRRQLAAGYAEVAKYGLLGDAPFFDWLDANQAAVLAGPGQALAQAIETCCHAKAAIVARDETETGDRALLNLGHTFGHALEAFTGYDDRLLHGEAVAIGMVLAFRLSEEKGYCERGAADRVAAHLAAAGLPTRIADVPGDARPDAATMVGLMAQDKKVKRGHPTFILARGIGQAFICHDVSWAEVESFLGLHCQ
jgi:shikimate kinase/3-dehydroquinate synthase